VRVWTRGKTLNINISCTTKGHGKIHGVVGTFAKYEITSKKGWMRSYWIIKKLEQLNAKIQTLEHGSEFVGQQEALSSQSLKMEGFQ